MNTPTALEIKATLIDYFRFKRQWLCAPEVSWDCGLADILIDTGTEIREVEIKISKSDLYNNEIKKLKHSRGVKCNRFYICAPTYLIDDTIKWVEQTEPFYGVIEYLVGVVRSSVLDDDFIVNVLRRDVHQGKIKCSFIWQDIFGSNLVNAALYITHKNSVT